MENRDQPLVTVVTPCLNSAPFLEQTIESVLSQDYPRLEYLVMDGGSTDGTLDILRRYDSRLQWRSGKDGGQAAAVNKGFQLTRGEIFTFLNSDDTYLPGAIERAVGAFANHPSAGVVYGEAWYTDREGNRMERYPAFPFDRELLSRRCYLCQPAAFLRREAFAACGMLNPALHYGLDYDLWIRLSKVFDFVKVDEYLATSRMHLENKTLKHRDESYQEVFQILKRHYGYVPFEWTYGYACFQIDRQDQFFRVSRPSLRKIWHSFQVGASANPDHPLRFTAEWFTAMAKAAAGMLAVRN